MARATPAPPTIAAVPAVPSADVERRENTEVRGRRVNGERNWLAREVDRVLRSNPDARPTVTELARQITTPSGENPSSGAVAAVLLRWSEGNYARLERKRPMRFNGFYKAWESATLDDYLAKQKSGKRK